MFVKNKTFQTTLIFSQVDTFWSENTIDVTFFGFSEAAHCFSDSIINKEM